MAGKMLYRWYVAVAEESQNWAPMLGKIIEEKGLQTAQGTGAPGFIAAADAQREARVSQSQGHE